jgi:15-cis-phytoene synthase
MITVDEAYALCRKIAHKHGANFSVGFRFLPRPKRRAVYAAYAFCRWADDIADEEDDARVSGASENAATTLSRAIPRDREARQAEHLCSMDSSAESLSSVRMENLDACQRELDACYEGRPSHPITIALADALRHFAIPKSAFLALIEGCRQDMVKTRYETFDELLHYCDLVASSISDISLTIFGYRTAAAIDHGRKLSTALQLTNVTRDIGDDLSRNRVYLPQEDLRKFGVTEQDLFQRAESHRLRALIEFQIARAEEYFRAAEPLLKELAFDARFPTLLMGGIYATVLANLRKDPLMVIRKRFSLSRLQKVLVVTTRLLRPHFV